VLGQNAAGDLVELRLNKSLRVREPDLCADVRDPTEPALGVDRRVVDHLAQRVDHAALRVHNRERRIVGRRAESGERLLPIRIVHRERAAHPRKQVQNPGGGGVLLFGERLCIEALRHADDLLSTVRSVFVGLRLPALVDARDVAARLSRRDAVVGGKSPLDAPRRDASAQHLFGLLDALLYVDPRALDLFRHRSPQ